MKEKKAIIRELKARYQKAKKKRKKMILDEFCGLTGYNRCYAARVLRAKEKQAKGSTRKKRKSHKIYDESIMQPLKKIWATLDGICGKRIKASLLHIIPVLEKHKEIELDHETREKLTHISAATIDRLLASERKKVLLKARSGTKPGTLLKHQIPIRTFSDWNEKKPGFVEIDLVSHEGGDLRGDFAQTLNLTDVCSGWTEIMAVKNKAQIWVFEALKNIRGKLPFELLGVDSDNGSEFINAHLFRYCIKEKITFTRSRPYRKNDNCFVEQKNYTIVRRYAGYRRYDTGREIEVLNKLYSCLGLYTNFFLPNMKLVEKTRIGSKVKKKYDDPKTPYQRLLDSKHITEETKSKLKDQCGILNPVQLKKTIHILQDKLYKANKLKRELKEKEVEKTSAFEYILNESTNTHLEYIFK
jgi:hypothetical protein